jgi:geranylgeranyl diphosphate synthase type II
MCGGDWQKAAPFAAAIEMIHTYSLIHDDLPSMDNDDFRRGRPTNHKVHGEAMAILAGDGLLTDAFLQASSMELSNPGDMALAIGVLAQNAGSLGMVGGQVLDIMAEQRELTEQEVLDIQSRKTGCLIRAACALGAIAGGATEAQFDAACQFAAALGLAFQIRDDMLDVIGIADEFGKPIGSDREEGKVTFVDLFGVDGCQKAVLACTAAAKEAVAAYDTEGFLSYLADSLARRKK